MIFRGMNGPKEEFDSDSYGGSEGSGEIASGRLDEGFLIAYMQVIWGRSGSFSYGAWGLWRGPGRFSHGQRN